MNRLKNKECSSLNDTNYGIIERDVLNESPYSICKKNDFSFIQNILYTTTTIALPKRERIEKKNRMRKKERRSERT